MAAGKKIGRARQLLEENGSACEVLDQLYEDISDFIDELEESSLSDEQFEALQDEIAEFYLVVGELADHCEEPEEED